MASQWLLTTDTKKALDELEGLKLKYPWLKCDTSLAYLRKMEGDLGKLLSIINHQEKQNNIHKEFIRVNQLADEAIVKAVEAKFNL